MGCQRTLDSFKKRSSYFLHFMYNIAIKNLMTYNPMVNTSRKSMSYASIWNYQRSDLVNLNILDWKMFVCLVGGGGGGGSILAWFDNMLYTGIVNTLKKRLDKACSSHIPLMIKSDCMNNQWEKWALYCSAEERGVLFAGWGAYKLTNRGYLQSISLPLILPFISTREEITSLCPPDLCSFYSINLLLGQSSSPLPGLFPCRAPIQLRK